MRPLAPGSRVTTPVGTPLHPPQHSPPPHSSLHPPAITMGRDVEVQDTQMIRCWTFTALAAQPQGLAGQQPNRSLFFFFFWYFYFHKTLLRPWMIIFKAGGVKASVWVVVEGYNKAYCYPTAEPKPGWWMIIDILLILRSYYTCGSVCVCFIL